MFRQHFLGVFKYAVWQNIPHTFKMTQRTFFPPVQRTRATRQIFYLYYAVSFPIWEEAQFACGRPKDSQGRHVKGGGNVHWAGVIGNKEFKVLH